MPLCALPLVRAECGRIFDQFKMCNQQAAMQQQQF